ncbi:MAG: hypothetical protein II072_01710 [Clostridia bacterium]|nr:hypothetical protein [Clostridia bacterium]MBQ3938147.1 hypothetical protein [Clostridia bacterium]MBQ5488561.1 hypothetical protein [Clostridia bacterium]
MKSDFFVYFNTDFGEDPGRRRPGDEIRVNKEFEFAGRHFVIPSLWSCAGGIVVDVIMKVDASAFFAYKKKWGKWVPAPTSDPDSVDPDRSYEAYSTNPASFEYDAVLYVNGRTLDSAFCCGISYMPIVDSPYDAELTDSIIRHYGLPRGAGFMLIRHHFAWKRRVKEIRALEIELTELPFAKQGPEFTAESAGQAFRFTDGIAGIERELRVIDLHQMNNELRDVEDRARIVGVNTVVTLIYKLEPELESGDIRLRCRVGGKDASGTTGGPYKEGTLEPLNEYRIASSAPFRGSTGKVSWKMELYPPARVKTVRLIP